VNQNLTKINATRLGIYLRSTKTPIFKKTNKITVQKNLYKPKLTKCCGKDYRLIIQSTKSTSSTRSFAVAGLKLWNELPSEICDRLPISD